jgi:hypothetical protein
VASEFRERRRYPRVQAEGRLELRIGRHVRVRLLDISGTGALLATGEPLPVGTRARLQLLLGPSPFESAVEVVREGPTPDARERLAGVAIVSPSNRPNEALEDFLRRAGS